MRPILLAGVLLAAVPAGAAPCTPPPPVASYLAGHPGWRLLSPADLVADDRGSWRHDHAHECPGMAVVALDASGVKSYALALVRAHGAATTERFVVLLAPSFRAVVLSAPSGDAGLVIYRAPPGVVPGWDDPRKKIRIRHDSIVLERMESASQQYYLARRRFRMIQTGD